MNGMPGCTSGAWISSLITVAPNAAARSARAARVSRECDGAGGVVRVAQQDRARSPGEGRLDAEEVELPAGLGLDERHALDDGAGLGDALVERRVDRRGDDHAVARLGHLSQQLDDAHHHVARRADARGIDRPAESTLGEPRVRVSDAGIRRRVSGVAELNGAGEHPGDRIGHRKVGLGDEQRQDLRPGNGATSCWTAVAALRWAVPAGG